MVDLLEISRMLTEYNGKRIFYNPIDNEFISFTNLEYLRANSGYMLKGNKIVKGVPSKLEKFLKKPDEFIPLFEYDDHAYLTDAQNFINRYKAEFLEFGNDKITFFRFKKYIKSHNLYDLWIEFFAESISFETFYWTIDYELLEEETDSKYYKKIRELVDELKGYNFKKQVTSDMIFTIHDDYDKFSFILLGSMNINNGISFILDGDGENYFDNMMSEAFSESGLFTFNTLTKCINFYFDGNDENFKSLFGMENPYGKDNLVTSIQIIQGYQSHSRLSKSAANLSIKYLEKSIFYLKEFVNSQYSKEVNLNDEFKIMCYKSSDETYFEVTKYEGEGATGFAFDPDSDFFPILKHVKIRKGEQDFIFRVMPGYLYQEDVRDIQYAYVLMLCDHKEKYIDDAILGETTIYHPLKTFFDKTLSEKREIQIAKNIFTNTPYDFAFASRIFAKFISKGLVKVHYVNDDLNADKLFSEFSENFENYKEDTDA